MINIPEWTSSTLPPPYLSALLSPRLMRAGAGENYLKSDDDDDEDVDNGGEGHDHRL